MDSRVYIFSWDINGVEAIAPIEKYRDWETQQAFEKLANSEYKLKPNPANEILNRLKLRARYNPQRFYEIYLLECEKSLTPSVWSKMWQKNPQQCAQLIREHGVHILGQPLSMKNLKIYNQEA